MKSFQAPQQMTQYHPPTSGPIGGNSVVFFPTNTLQCQSHFGGNPQIPVKYHGMMQIHQTTQFGAPNSSPTLHTATVHGEFWPSFNFPPSLTPIYPETSPICGKSEKGFSCSMNSGQEASKIDGFFPKMFFLRNRYRLRRRIQKKLFHDIKYRIA